MIITIKNLQQQTFTVDFSEEKTILELKRKIFLDRGSEYLVEKQKLIYAGVILSDERTIASYNVDEKKFLVVMLKRDLVVSAGPSANVSAKVNDGKENKNSTENSEILNRTNTENEITGKDTHNLAKADDTVSEFPANNPTTDNNSTNTVSEGTINVAPTFSQAESNLLMGDDYNKSIDSIIEMGYCREMVEKAMAASFNNPERAVEYLINGIPEVEIPSETQENVRIQNDQLRPADTAESRTDDPFEFLRNQPQFLQMRSLVYENPDLLHAVLQQIGQTNPDLLHLISEHQDEFLGMINEPMEERTSDGQQRQRSFRGQPIREIPIGILGNEQIRNTADNARSQQNAGERVTRVDIETQQNPSASSNSSTETTMQETGDANTDEQRRHNLSTGNRPTRNETEGVTTLRLTAQDQDAIERLKALGFPETLVLQAYFACEKDEQLAANFLISSEFDD